LAKSKDSSPSPQMPANPTGEHSSREPRSNLAEINEALARIERLKKIKKPPGAAAEREREPIAGTGGGDAPAEPADPKEAEFRVWEAARREEAAASDAGLTPLEWEVEYGTRFYVPRMAAPQAGKPAAYVVPDPSQCTEIELAGIISECRYFMRELAFHSARLTPNAEDRISFMNSACRLAETGARVGEAVARVRGHDVERPAAALEAKPKKKRQ